MDLLAVAQRDAVVELLRPYRHLMVVPSDPEVLVTDSYLSAGDVTYEPGLIDEVAVTLFTEGWCWALAVVLADVRGWSLWACGVDEDWDHVLVSPSPRLFLDITGASRGPLTSWGEPYPLAAAHIRTLDVDSQTVPAEALPAALSMVDATCDLLVADLLAH